MDVIIYLVVAGVGIATLSATGAIFLLPCRAFLTRRYSYDLQLLALQRLALLVELDRLDQQPNFRDGQMLASFERRLKLLKKSIDSGEDDRDTIALTAATVGLVSGDRSRLPEKDRFTVQLLRGYYAGTCIDKFRVRVFSVGDITRYKLIVHYWLLIAYVELAAEAMRLYGLPVAQRLVKQGSSSFGIAGFLSFIASLAFCVFRQVATVSGFAANIGCGSAIGLLIGYDFWCYREIKPTLQQMKDQYDFATDRKRGLSGPAKWALVLGLLLMTVFDLLSIHYRDSTMNLSRYLLDHFKRVKVGDHLPMWAGSVIFVVIMVTGLVIAVMRLTRQMICSNRPSERMESLAAALLLATLCLPFALAGLNLPRATVSHPVRYPAWAFDIILGSITLSLFCFIAAALMRMRERRMRYMQAVGETMPWQWRIWAGIAIVWAAWFALGMAASFVLIITQLSQSAAHGSTYDSGTQQIPIWYLVFVASETVLAWICMIVLLVRRHQSLRANAKRVAIATRSMQSS